MKKIKSLQEKNIEIPLVEKHMMFRGDVVITGRGVERLEQSYDLKRLDTRKLNVETSKGLYLYDSENDRVIVSPEYIFKYYWGWHTPETLNETLIKEYIIKGYIKECN